MSSPGEFIASTLAALQELRAGDARHSQEISSIHAMAQCYQLEAEELRRMVTQLQGQLGGAPGPVRRQVGFDHRKLKVDKYEGNKIEYKRFAYDLMAFIP